MSRVLGFDFGMKHIGVAVGQSLTKTATPLTTLSAKDGIPKWEEIETLLQYWKPKNLVVGIPLNMDGTEQPLTFCAKKFANRLKAKFKLPVHYVDERLTTWEAKHRVLRRPVEYRNTERKTMKKDKKEIQDVNAVSAAIIVEQWLNSE